MSEERQTTGPYPGLRPFQEFEAAYLYGRQAQIKEVIARLRKTQFVAVLGGSGSGKSSLILAGVIPELRSYALEQAGDFWVPVVSTPGTNLAQGQSPVVRLAQKFCALLEPLPEPEGSSRVDDCAALLRSPDGLGLMLERFAPRLEDTGGLNPCEANFLFLIDQFEELFHPSNRGLTDCDIVVQRVLDNFHRPHAHAYVVITMRSEHLSDCARYLELPDAINAASYLVRRLDSAQIRESIEKPALRQLRLLMRRSRQRQRANRSEAAGAPAPEQLPETCAFQSAMLDRLLRDTEELRGNPDHLPLLQHLLFRLWEASMLRAKDEGLTLPGEIRLEELERAVGADYACAQPPALPERANCLEACLESWAQRLYESAPQKQARLEQVFRSLAFKEPNTGTYTQQRIAWDTLVGLLGLEGEAELRGFLEPWLTPHPYLYWDTDSRTIKVAHESFIRGWRQFHVWVDQDDEQFQEYVRLLDECQRWEQSDRSSAQLIGGARLKRVCDVTLDRALDTPASVERFSRLLELHHDGARLKPFVTSAREFVQESIREQQRREAQERHNAELEKQREREERQRRHEEEKNALRRRGRRILYSAAAVVVGALALLLVAEAKLGKKERLLHRAFAIASEAQLANDAQFRSLDSAQLPLRNLLVAAWHYDQGQAVKIGLYTHLILAASLRRERADASDRTLILADVRNAAAMRAVLTQALWPVAADKQHDDASVPKEPRKCTLQQDTSSAPKGAPEPRPQREFYARHSDAASGLIFEGSGFEPLQIYAATFADGQCRGTLVLSLPPPYVQGTHIAVDADMKHVLVRLDSGSGPSEVNVQRYDINWRDHDAGEVTAEPRGSIADLELARRIWPDADELVVMRSLAPVMLPTVFRPAEHATDVRAGEQWLRIFSSAPGASRALAPSFKAMQETRPERQCGKLEMVIRKKTDEAAAAEQRIREGRTQSAADRTGTVDVQPLASKPQVDGQRPTLERMLEQRDGERVICVAVFRHARPVRGGGAPEGNDNERLAAHYVATVYKFDKEMPVENKRVAVTQGIDIGTVEPKEVFVSSTAGPFQGWLAARADPKAPWSIAPWGLAAWRSFACPVFRPGVADQQPDVEKFGPAFDLIRKPTDGRDETPAEERLCDSLNGRAAKAGNAPHHLTSR